MVSCKSIEVVDESRVPFVGNPYEYILPDGRGGTPGADPVKL